MSKSNEILLEANALFLGKYSEEICETNGCTEDDHKCESYAYIQVETDVNVITGVTMLKEHALLTVCAPDYFQGCSSEHVALPLPWDGSADELEASILELLD